MSSEPTTPSLGALPPEGSGWQIGDRADKPCVMAAFSVLRKFNVSIPFDCAQNAIDAYLA